MLIQSDAAAPSETHHTTVTDKGSFATARCTCGWKGPARRARDRARRDAQAHTDE